MKTDIGTLATLEMFFDSSMTQLHLIVMESLKEAWKISRLEWELKKKNLAYLEGSFVGNFMITVKDKNVFTKLLDK